MSQGLIKKPYGLVKQASGKWGSTIGGVTPDSITGLNLWFEGDLSICDITKDGADRVSAWASGKTPTDILAQAVSGAQPLWVESVSLANNAAGVQFNGTSDFISGNTVDTSQPFTIIFLATEPTDNDGYRTLFSDILVNKTFRQAGATANAPVSLLLPTALSAGNTIAGNPLARWRLQVNGATSNLYKNGALVSSGDVGGNNLGGLVFGARYDGTTYFANTTVICFLLYNHLITVDELALLNTYLTPKFGAGV